ncbi:MAG: hypothetical protein ACEPOW_13710 [Bacteroidales bacterium]
MLLGSGPERVFKSFQEEQSDILDVFTKTEVRLENQNIRISNEVSKKEAEIKEMESYCKEIKEIKKKNLGILSRIKSILGGAKILSF